MGFLYSQLFVTPTYPTKDHSGQTVIVTGANVGLGLEAARHFVRLGAEKVILAVRSAEKGKAAVENIKASTGCKAGLVEVWSLDLSSYASVKAFAKKAEQLPRLDVVVENAGIATDVFKKVEEDESTITVNVVSTMLLAVLLIPTLRKSGKKTKTVPVLSIVSSEVHGWSKFEERKTENIFNTLSNPKTANMKERYPTSKLLEVYSVRELASIITSTSSSSSPDVILNMINPGLCQSELARDSKSLFLTILKFLLARTTEVGSRNLVMAASAGAESHGKYFSDTQVKEEDVSPMVTGTEGKEVQKKVWSELTKKLENIQPSLISALG